MPRKNKALGAFINKAERMIMVKKMRNELGLKGTALDARGVSLPTFPPHHDEHHTQHTATNTLGAVSNDTSVVMPSSTASTSVFPAPGMTPSHVSTSVAASAPNDASMTPPVGIASPEASTSVALRMASSDASTSTALRIASSDASTSSTLGMASSGATTSSTLGMASSGASTSTAPRMASSGASTSSTLGVTTFGATTSASSSRYGRRLKPHVIHSPEASSTAQARTSSASSSSCVSLPRRRVGRPRKSEKIKQNGIVASAQNALEEENVTRFIIPGKYLKDSFANVRCYVCGGKVQVGTISIGFEVALHITCTDCGEDLSPPEPRKHNRTSGAAIMVYQFLTNDIPPQDATYLYDEVERHYA